MRLFEFIITFITIKIDELIDFVINFIRSQSETVEEEKKEECFNLCSEGGRTKCRNNHRKNCQNRKLITST